MPELVCVVCSDSTTTGRHYGVNCCLGCKSFFRRAIVRKRMYFCEKNNRCDVSQRSGRQSCRACRLQKCFAVGMNRSALHPQRDMLGRREDLDQPNTSQGDSFDVAVDLMKKLLQIDDLVRQKKLDKFRVQNEAKQLSIANGTARFRTANDEYYADGLRIVSMADMATVTSEELYSMLEWADSLPDFRQLPVSARTSLLRKFAIFHIVLELCYHTARSNLDDVWLFPNESCMPRDVSALPLEKQRLVTQQRRWRQEKLYNIMTSKCIDEVAMPMRAMQLSEEEFVVLKLIMLFRHETSDASDVADSADNSAKREILAIRQRAINALFAHYRNSNVENYPERFGNVLLSISGIVSAAAALQEAYQVMRLFDIVPFDLITQELIFHGGVE